jgi:hypothetical protein
MHIFCILLWYVISSCRRKGHWDSVIFSLRELTVHGSPCMRSEEHIGIAQKVFFFCVLRNLNPAMKKIVSLYLIFLI